MCDSKCRPVKPRRYILEESYSNKSDIPRIFCGGRGCLLCVRVQRFCDHQAKKNTGNRVNNCLRTTSSCLPNVSIVSYTVCSMYMQPPNKSPRKSIYVYSSKKIHNTGPFYCLQVNLLAPLVRVPVEMDS